MKRVPGMPVMPGISHSIRTQARENTELVGAGESPAWHASPACPAEVQP